MIPTREDINIHDSLDEQTACENFLGKNLDEAEFLFRNSNVFEDLMWMGPVAFRYYVQAAIRYVESDVSVGDWEAARFLLPPLEFRLEDEPKEMAPVARQLAALCDYVVTHRQKFDADKEMVSRYMKLRDGFSSLIE